MRKFLLGLFLTLGLVGVAPAVANAQSETYLHVAYAQQQCNYDTRPSALATFNATLGGGQSLYPIYDGNVYNRINNNRVQVWIWHFTALRTYKIQAACDVTGADVYKWSLSIALGYVVRA